MKLDNSLLGNHDSVLCSLPRGEKTPKAKAKIESHVDNLDFYLQFRVWMVCLGPSMPEMPLFFPIFSPGLIHVYEEK